MFDICNDILYSMIEASVTCIDTYYARAHRHTSTRTCAYPHAHTFDWYTRPQTHSWTHTCARTHARTRARMYTCTHTHKHICSHIRTHSHARNHADTRMHVDVQIIYTHTVTNMLARTYVRKLVHMHTWNCTSLAEFIVHRRGGVVVVGWVLRKCGGVYDLALRRGGCQISDKKALCNTWMAPQSKQNKFKW